MSRWVTKHFLPGVIAIEVVAGLFLVVYIIREDISFPHHLLFVFFALWAALIPWILLWTVCSQRMNRAVLHSLEQDCDPEPLLHFSRDMLRQFDPKARKRTPAVLLYRLNEATALQCLGLFGDAQARLDGIEPRLPKKPGLATLVYWNNRAALCYHLDRAEEMGRHLAQSETQLEALKLSPAQRDMYQFALRTNYCAQRFLEDGPTPAVEREYQYLLDHASTQRQRVGFHLTLGRCALARRDTEAAPAHLRYTADHGGKLFVRRQAQELLAQLAQPEAQA